MFDTKVLTLSVLQAVICGVDAFEFLTTPGPVSACVGGDAVFPWSYDAVKYSQIQMVYWRFEGTGRTVLGHHYVPADELVYYDDYPPDKVETLEENAGIRLRSVDLSDAGRYRVELSGVAGGEGSASLEVYEVDSLTPTVQIDNQNVQFDAESNVTSCRSCIVVVTTAHALSADIVLRSGGRVVPCEARTTCSMSLNWAGGRSESMVIEVRVDYGFCEEFSRPLTVYWGDPGTDDGGYDYSPTDENAKDDGQHQDGGDSVINTSLIIGVVIGVLLTVIIILVVFVCLLYMRLKKKSKSRGLSSPEDRFVKVVRNWRSLARQNRANRRRDNPAVTRSLSSPADRISLHEEAGVSFLSEAVKPEEEENRSDPDGQDGPKLLDDPELPEAGIPVLGDPDDVSRLESPSPDDAVEARESDMGSVSPACSRIDSIDSSYVMVPRTPDGSECSLNSARTS